MLKDAVIPRREKTEEGWTGMELPAAEGRRAARSRGQQDHVALVAWRRLGSLPEERDASASRVGDSSGLTPSPFWVRVNRILSY